MRQSNLVDDMKLHKKNCLIFCGIAWIVIIFFCIYLLMQYEGFPGEKGRAPQFLAPNKIIKTTNLPTLILFVHPRCPCTRATINELSIIMTKCKDKVNANVLFFTPTGYPDSWAKTDTYYSTKLIPQVKVYFDRGGKQIKRFHALTSGHVLLYDSSKKLIFSGGITKSRGNIGANLGLYSVIEKIKANKEQKVTETSVYGCSFTKKKLI